MKPLPSVALLSALLIHAIPCGAAGKTQPAAPAAPKAPVAKKPASPAGPVLLSALPEGEAALKLWRQEGYAWTPKVSAAYLAFAKAQALKEIAAAGQTDKFPADFLAFVDNDPQVALTVYGFQPTGAANRLRLLRSLELDLGKETVRGDKYRQFALAMVAVRGNSEGPAANLQSRAPMKFEIPADPRVIVDTKPKDRPLDVNDHIINFLNDHAPIPDDGRTHRVVWPELAYDANGKAIDADKVQPQKIETDEASKDGAPAPQKMRRIYACDVIASAQIEKEFNDYMAAHGQSVRVDCGMPNSPARLHWRSNEAKGVNGRGITAAYNLFLGAYRAKGYFPAKADPAPTAAESLAYYRMIGDFVAPPEAKMKGPRFDFVHAPWPILVYLAQDTQSIRGRADMWERYIKTGEFHGYGEYTGGIAQMPVLLRARRLTPFAFENNTVQMMAKDGGVCGTMGKLAVYDMACLGAPASTAGQPGHCCLVRIVGGPGAYNLVGGQYATGGDRSTDPHNPFIFDGGSHQYMLIHQSVPHAVNAGMESFLGTLAARSFFLALPDDLRREHGLPLLCSAIELNPYNVSVINQAQAAASTPLDFVAIHKAKSNGLAKLAGKTGCPPDTGMFVLKREESYAKLAKLPVPENRAEAAAVLAVLRAEKCAVAQLITDYTLAAEGEAGAKALVEKLETDFAAHVAGGRNPGICAAMARRIKELADSKCPEGIKQSCMDRLRELIKGRENYNFKQATARSMWYSGVDECATALAKMVVDRKIAKAGLPAFIAETETAFKGYATAARTDSSCAFMTDALTTILGQWTDKKQSKAWAAARLKEIAGYEKYVAGTGSALVVKTDPCVPLLARYAGAKLPSEQEMTQPLLDRLTLALKRHVVSARTLADGHLASWQLTAGVAAIRDPRQKIAWIGNLASIIRGKETFEITVPGKKPQMLRDPVADMVANMVAQGTRAAGFAGDLAAFTAWSSIADKSLPPVAPADVFLTPQQAAAHPKMEPFSGQLLSPEGMLRASSVSRTDKPLTYKDILRPGIGGWLHSNPEAKPWLQVELPGDSELTGIILVGRYEHPKENPTRTGALPMKVKVSLDGKTWTDVATFETVQDVYRVDLEGRKTKARYIRAERAPAADQKAGDFEFRNVLVYGRKSR